MEKLKIGILGCGTISQVHLDSIKSFEQADLEMVCDIKIERAKVIASKYNCRYTGNSEELINDPNLTCIHVLTPHFSHFELAKKVLETKKHCLLEKPMTTCTKDAKELIRIAEDSKQKLGIVFQNRLNTTSQYIRKIIDSNTYGKLIGIKASVTWYRNRDYYMQESWRGKWGTAGGGVLINQAIHTLDLLQWFSGEIESVSGTYGTYLYPDLIEVEDNATLIMQFKNNIRGLLFASNSHVINSPITMELVFEEGILELDGSKLFLKKQDETLLLCEDITATGEKSYWGKGHEMLIHRFYKSIIYDTDDYIHAKEGAQTIEILERFYQCANQQNKITVDNIKE